MFTQCHQQKTRGSFKVLDIFHSYIVPVYSFPGGTVESINKVIDLLIFEHVNYSQLENEYKLREIEIQC